MVDCFAEALLRTSCGVRKGLLKLFSDLQSSSHIHLCLFAFVMLAFIVLATIVHSFTFQFSFLHPFSPCAISLPLFHHL